MKVRGQHSVTNMVIIVRENVPKYFCILPDLIDYITHKPSINHWKVLKRFNYLSKDTYNLLNICCKSGIMLRLARYSI